MYRYVLVSPRHRPYQRIYWRADPNGPILEYELLTVTYGTRAAPHTAIRTVLQLAEDTKELYPKASKALEKNFYVDDALSGADTEEELVQLYNELRQCMAFGGFTLSKWMSDNQRVREILKLPQPDGQTLNLDGDAATTVLGLCWNPTEGVFTFKTTEMSGDGNTKRQIAKLYDPVGFVSPIVIKAKLIIQQFWLTKVDWDDEIPVELKTAGRPLERNLLE